MKNESRSKGRPGKAEALRMLDDNLKRLPVPSAGAKAKENLLRKLQYTAQASPAPKPTRRVLPFIGVAAGVASVGIWLGVGGKGNQLAAAPADPLLAIVVQCNVTLAADANATPEAKLRSLTALAGELSEKMNDIARVDVGGENLDALAKLFAKVVSQGVVEQANDVERGNRILALNDTLNALKKMTDEAGSRIDSVPPAAADSFRKVNKTAQQGADRIRALLTERAS